MLLQQRDKSTSCGFAMPRETTCSFVLRILRGEVGTTRGCSNDNSGHLRLAMRSTSRNTTNQRTAVFRFEGVPMLQPVGKPKVPASRGLPSLLTQTV